MKSRRAVEETLLAVIHNYQYHMIKNRDDRILITLMYFIKFHMIWFGLIIFYCNKITKGLGTNSKNLDSLLSIIK
jgi:hypothetical protein